MRLVFAGTPRFAELALDALLAAGHDVSLVLTQPDRKAGRGLQASSSPVKRHALERGLSVFQPQKLSDADALEKLRAATPHVLIVAAYGLILPQAALDVAARGAINIHASLLPRWRGAAPIQRAILAGDPITGVTIMQMDAGLDTGAMLRQSALPMAPEETTLSLHDRVAALGAQMIVDVLRDLERGPLTAVPQPEEGVTYAQKIDKREAVLDWRAPSVALDRAVRAFNPAPGARATLDGVELKIWRARCGTGRGAPGRVQSVGDEGIEVACGEGTLVLTELQRSGGKRLGTRDFLRGLRLQSGAQFALPV